MRRINRPSRSLSKPERYGISILVAAIATALSASFPVVLEPMRFMFFWAAVMVAALAGGTGPGVLCVALCVAGAAATVLQPMWSFAVSGPLDAFHLVLFVFVALAVSWAIGLRRRAEEEAKNLREWLGTTLNSIGDAVVATDENGVIVFVNRVAEGLTGWTADEWRDKPFDSVFRIVHEETERPLASPVRHVLETGTAKALENHASLIRKDGTRVPIDDSAAPILRENRSLRGAVVVFRDVSAKRRAERDLKQNERLFRNLADTAPVLIWMTDAEGNCSFLNKAWLDFTGKPLEAELGTGWVGDIHADDSARVTAAREKSYAARSPLEVEYRMRRHDGEYRWMLDRGLPRKTAEGECEGFTGSIVDITERRETEDARIRLLAAQTAARAAAETTGRRATYLAEASAILGSSLDYDEALRALARLTIQSMAEWCFVDLATETGGSTRLVVAHQDAAKVWRARELEDRLMLGSPRVSAGVSSRAEIIREIDGIAPKVWSELGIRSVASVPLVARDRVLGTISFASGESRLDFADTDVALFEEVARRAAIAIDNARLYSLALNANRAKDEFLATLSHELRTPLTAILGWAKMLRTTSLEPETETLALETIERSAKAQAELIEDLLDVSRIITGKLKLEVKPAALQQIVADVASSLRPAAEAKGVSLSIEGAPGAPRIPADARRLRQVIWNLLSNAIKFSRRDGHVSVKIEPTSDSLRFSVSDDGIGIAPEFLPHVFERFRQANSTVSRQHGGLGLGLAIVKELVELHGGTVRAQSDGLNRGTMFTAEFPLEHHSPPEADTQERLMRSVHGNLSGRRVLVVDDQEDARRVIKAMLELHGAEVATAADTSQALAKLQSWQPHAVVSDLAMPGEDGYALAARIRSSREDGQLPLIALTALADPDEGSRAKRSGFDRLLRKPITPAQLATAVAELLGLE